jgi:hypothetical protein
MVVERIGRTSSSVELSSGEMNLKCADQYSSRRKFCGDSITYTFLAIRTHVQELEKQTSKVFKMYWELQ